MFGTIRRVFADKGYGFIAPDEGGEDVFVYHTQLAGGLTLDQLRHGDRVTYDEYVDQTRGKIRACAVVRL